MLTFFRRRGDGRLHRFVRPRDLRRSLVRFGVYLLLVLTLHTLAMMAFEGMALGDALWLTFTTVVTVGYGDYSAGTLLGRTATVVLLYLGGVFVLFQAAADYFDYRAERRQRMLRGQWRWEMQGHIVLLNVPAENPAPYLCRLVSEFRASRRYRELPILIVTPRFPEGLPAPLHDLGVAHYTGSADHRRALEAAGVRAAAVIVVLARQEADEASDGRTFDIVSRLTELGATGRLLAECVDDGNRERLRRAGAHIVVRPLRGYPEMIVRAFAAPGAEHILEDLFTSRGDECWRYDVRVRGARWAEVVRALVEADIGVPIAYRAAEGGGVVCNPPPEARLEADKLFVLVRAGNQRPDEEVAAVLAGLGSGSLAPGPEPG